MTVFILSFPSSKNDHLNLKGYIRKIKLQADKNEQGNLIIPSSSSLRHWTAEEYKQTREHLKINVSNNWIFLLAISQLGVKDRRICEPQCA